MGNLQSTPSSSTTTTFQKKYDVFLSFRGKDTRNCFTCHLYEALHKKNETFIDDGLEKGDGIWPTVKAAIEQSKISVVIFSNNYASSKWCLRELVEIMERNNLHNQIVIPVFYHVDPSDVRIQTGSFKYSFDKHGKESQEEVQKWREALTEASNLSGWDSSVTRPDTTLIDQIVKDIQKKLMSEYISHDYGGLIGHERIEQVISLLCLHVRSNVQIIGIWGMGGIGKTTIADAIFKKSSNRFEGVCFIQNVRERLQNSRGLVSLQKEILSEVLKDEQLKLDSPTIPSTIKERLNRTKVLIVLDDVDDYLPLENLARGVDRLGLGSRIIITSRDKHVLQLCRVNDQNIYEVEGFNNHDALRLFCNYAFDENYPPKDRTVLSNKLVYYSKGNPLALKVLGSSLYQKSKQEWESGVNTLRTNLNRGIFDVLKISYDGLDYREKNIFLDIACFFKGKDRDYVEKIISDCCYSLGVLNDKSLITISSGWIEMHDLLEEMGREIVDKESPNKPGKRSRLWRQEEVQNTLKYDEGTNAVQGIVLDLKKIKDIQLSTQAFKKMYNLRILNFYDYGPNLYFECPYNSKVHFPNGLIDLSGKLTSLIWHGFPLIAMPSKFNPENLVELDLRKSNLERLWEDTMHAPNLKRLILYGCKCLTNIPDLSNAPLLEMIDLKYCRSLLDFPPLAQHLKYLHHLDLCGCKSLRSFPDFPCSLTNLYLSDCNLKEIPEDICHLSLLEDLDLSGNDFESLPKGMKQLSILKNLNVNNCNMLQSLTELPLSIEFLSASDCKQLRSIPDASELVEAIFIFTNCPNLEETAVGNILATVEGYEGELDQFSFCCPGSEVPGWFSYKSKESSIEFRMAWHDCFNGQVLGFIVCVVTEFEEYLFDANDGVGLVVECRWIFNDEDESYPLFWSGRCILVAAPNIGKLIDSDHVAFGYCKAFDHQVLKSEFTNCSFKFQLSDHSPNCRVKSCGVRPITKIPNEDDKVKYAEPIKISGVTIEDIGETSGKRSHTSNDHQEEEVEPYSKRLNLDRSL